MEEINALVAQQSAKIGEPVTLSDVVRERFELGNQTQTFLDAPLNEQTCATILASPIGQRVATCFVLYAASSAISVTQK